MKLHELPARAEEGFHVVVESPRGSPLKLVYDPESGAVFGGRALPLGLAYPYDWGFVPGTRAPDGDPLDALVYWDVPSFPGVVLRCRLLGALQLEQDEEGGERVRNDRVIAVPLGHVRGDDVRAVGELSPRVRDELAHFFTSAVYFNAKNPKVLGWSDPAAAERLVEEHRAKR